MVPLISDPDPVGLAATVLRKGQYMPTTFEKRQKEQKRAEKQRGKEAKRKQRRAEGDKPAQPHAPGEDPDIAGIVPGPQPIITE